MDWQEAGRAGGARPADWAYLFEPHARPANEVIFDQLGVGEGTRLLGIACGAGFAAQLAARRGAAVAGIDASDALVRIARARTADGDFRLGDVFALPFPGACFDVATSFNGIWKGCEAALREAARVLVPGGRLGLAFWGRPDHVGLMPYFLQDHRAVTAQPRRGQHPPGRHRAARCDRGDAGLGRLHAARAREGDGHERVARCQARRPGAGRGRPLGPRHPGGWARPVLRGAAGGDRTPAHPRCRDPDRFGVRLDHRRTPTR